MKLALHSNPLRVGVVEKNDVATVEGLQQVRECVKRGECSLSLFQGYVVCPSEKRFLLLFTFLKKNRNKKVMVFFSSCASVKFHHELLNYIDISVQCIHVSLERKRERMKMVVFRASRSRLSERPPSSSSARLSRAFYCARMLLRGE